MKTVGKINKIIGKILSYISPKSYWKFIGLHFGEDLKVYGNSFNMFGTEPWLIRIGNGVHITDGVRFITHDGGTLVLRNLDPKLEITQPITIGNNVYIGVDTIILPGVSIGDNVIIGAGSVVTQDICSNSVAAGVPAEKIKSLDSYYNKISKESLSIGHLSAKEKNEKLKNIYEEWYRMK